MKALVIVNDEVVETEVIVSHFKYSLNAVVCLEIGGSPTEFNVPATGFPEGGGYLFTADDLIKFLGQPIVL